MNFIESIPLFVKDIDYQELSPLEGKYKYRFITNKNIQLFLTRSIVPRGKKILFKDLNGRIWMTMLPHRIIISKDYAWDGCTPKKWYGIWWGTPDFEETIFASLIHDALLQFKNTKHFPFSRYEIDNLFKLILKEEEFIFTDIYYLGVRFGSMFSDKKYKVESSLTSISEY